MKARYLIVLAISLLSFSHLTAQECEAWFMALYSETDYHEVNFYNESFPQGDIASWNWQFGDGNSSSEQFPTHIYSENGTYNVILTIEAGDCSDTYQDSVYINENNFEGCFAYFYYDVSGDEFLDVSFYDASFYLDGGDSWFWEFGDGETSTEQNPVHIYSEGGIYEVELHIAEGEYSDSVSFTVYVGSEYFLGTRCYAAFSFAQPSPGGLTFEFYDASYSPSGSMENYYWDFGDGETSTEQNPIHSYITEGEYVVTLSINAGDCESEFSTFVFAGEENWYPDDCQAIYWFTTNPDNYKEFQFYDFSYSNEFIQSWEWKVNNSAISYLQNPLYEFPQDGVYDVSLQITTDFCESIFFMEIEVSENINPGDSLMPLFFPDQFDPDSVFFNNLSRGDITGQRWDFGDGEFSYAHDPKHKFTGGIHEVALSVWDEDEIENTIVVVFSTENKSAEDVQILNSYFYPGGINDINTVEINEIVVYPNPADDYIEINKPKQECNMIIYDITGRSVLQQNFCSDADKKIDVSKLDRGIYFVYINSGESVFLSKFVKK